MEEESKTKKNKSKKNTNELELNNKELLGDENIKKIKKNKSTFKKTDNNISTNKNNEEIQNLSSDENSVKTINNKKNKLQNIIKDKEFKNKIITIKSEIVNQSSEKKIIASTFPMPQYLGSKTKYINNIINLIPSDVKSILDAFSGSGIVSYSLKQRYYNVISNDLLTYNSLITKALIENNTIKLSDIDIEMLFEKNKNKKNFIEKEFTDLYYTKDECIFLDNLHSNIQKLDNEYKKAIAFSAIGRTLIRKILFAYFCHTKAIEYRKIEKHWKRNPVINDDIKKLFRSYLIEYNNAIIDNEKKNVSYNSDILTTIDKINVDMVYFDPPYGGTHSDYSAYYHFLETYINYWEDAKLYNNTKQAKDNMTKSKFTAKKLDETFEELFKKSSHIKYWIISYNSNATPTKEIFISMIKKYKKNIIIHEIELKKNNGGMGLREKSKEYLFLCY